jgi:hypothetical protein
VPARPDGRAFEDDFDLPVVSAGMREIERDSRVLLDRLPGEGDHDSDDRADVALPDRSGTADGHPVGMGPVETGPAGTGSAGDLAGGSTNGDGSDRDADDGEADGEVGGLPRRGRRARGRVPVPA